MKVLLSGRGVLILGCLVLTAAVAKWGVMLAIG